MSDYREDMARGEELVAAGKLEEARALFEQAVRAAPLDHEALNNLGTVLYLQGAAGAAEKFFLKSFSLNGDSTDVLANLADLYVSTNRPERALYFLEIYAGLAPRDHERLNQLAALYIESGYREKAVAALEKSQETRPDEKVRSAIEGLKRPVPPSGRKPAPLLSVGLPVYNGGKYIAQAIESILSQDFENFELIISDNCSTDQTRDICLHYRDRDRRIRYHRFDENLGMLPNFLNVLGRSAAPFFMFATHDDLRKKTFASTCLRPLMSEPSLALVFTRSSVLDADSNYLGIAMDGLNACQDSPGERFRHIIWEIGMCNAMLGIFRMSMLKKITCWGKALFGDTLLLAELSLLGKIRQMEEPLFIRRLTRNYNYTSHEERNSQLMAECDPKLFSEGISFPHCRLGYGHLEILNQSNLGDAEKEALMKDVFECFRQRYGAKMKYEIDRAVSLIDQGCFYHEWNQTELKKTGQGGPDAKSYFHMSSLLKRLEEALFFFPEREDLRLACGKCRDSMRLLAPGAV